MADLDRLLRPRSVAVVGASDDPRRIGGQPVRALKDFGFTGAVHPVNPRYETVQGLPCVPDLDALAEPCDVALVAVAAALVPGVIEACGRAAIPFAIVLSAGFEEAGGDAVQAELDAAIASSGVRVVGPNCQGLLNTADRVYAGFGSIFTNPDVGTGPIAMVTQSGGFGYAVVGLADHAGVGFNYVISTGNEADVDAVELMAHLLERDDVEMVAAYLEGVRDGRALVALGRRALELGKPIAVWKVGNSETGREAAASHTANLSAGYELYRAVFREGGFVEVDDVDDLVDVGRAVTARRRPDGPGVGVLTISGGAGVLLADRCEAAGLCMAELAPPTVEALRELLPAFSSARNPVDLTAQVFNQQEALLRVLTTVLADPGVDQVIVYAASIQGDRAERLAEELVAAAAETGKPVHVGWSAPPGTATAGMERLAGERIPVYPTPGRAARAAGALWEFAAKVARGARAEPERPVARAELAGGGEHAAKRNLAAYGVPVVAEVLLAPGEVEALTESPLPFPVAVKLDSPDVPHKSDAGAVRLGVSSLEELKAAARDVVEAVPGARVGGVLVQEMADGVELFVGAVNDAYFGPTVACGLGGIFVEVLGDVTHRVAPFGVETAREMLGELRALPLLEGARGTEPVDLDAVADALARVSWLAADHADRLAELDVNPLFARGGGVVAADALLVLKGGEDG